MAHEKLEERFNSLVRQFNRLVHWANKADERIKTLMSQYDDLLAASNRITASVTAVTGRVATLEGQQTPPTAPDLTPVTASLVAAADALDAIAQPKAPTT